MPRQPNAIPPVPMPGRGAFELIELGPPVHAYPPPEPKFRGAPIGAGDGEELLYRPPPGAKVRPPLVPTADELASLPKLAREAFAARCAARVPGASGPAEVAHRLVEQATRGKRLVRQLRCLRRDFDRLRSFSRKQNWTDDTPVPPEALGPLWPPGVAPGGAE